MLSQNCFALKSSYTVTDLQEYTSDRYYILVIIGKEGVNKWDQVWAHTTAGPSPQTLLLQASHVPSFELGESSEPATLLKM